MSSCFTKKSIFTFFRRSGKGFFPHAAGAGLRFGIVDFRFEELAGSFVHVFLSVIGIGEPENMAWSRNPDTAGTILSFA